jgi:hypothetical protein
MIGLSDHGRINKEVQKAMVSLGTPKSLKMIGETKDNITKGSPIAK